MAMPSTKERVPAHTAGHVNERIRRDIEASVKHYSARPEEIGQRLRELDAEWDIERAIEANASAIAFIGTTLGFFVHPYWLALPALVTAFLFQHAVQGWCPPIPILRRMGFRTVYEIEQEKQALKAIRGDYAGVTGSTDKSRAALRATET
jgi:hypothetical protein